MSDGNNMPNRKVVVGAFAGAATAILMEIIDKTTHAGFSPSFAVSLSVVITFIVQYLVPNAEV